MSMAPVLTAGTVYGVLLNSKEEWSVWAAQMNEPPYKAAPKAPVLCIKTANIWSACGAATSVPGHAPEVEIGASFVAVGLDTQILVRQTPALAALYKGGVMPMAAGDKVY